MVRFQFDKAAAQRLAVELRRASWGVAVFGGIYAKDGAADVLLMVAVVGWIGLQAAAYVADNLERN